MMANTDQAEQGVQMVEEEHTDTMEKPSLMKLRKELMFVNQGSSTVESTGKKEA